jgi:hypothetical protein
MGCDLVMREWIVCDRRERPTAAFLARTLFAQAREMKLDLMAIAKKWSRSAMRS